VPFRAQGAKPPLVMVHGHNGRVLFVQRLLWHLPPDRPIHAIQARGLDGRVAPHASVPEMAADYAREILAAFGRGPIFLAGYCYGGILAIETHRHLAAAGVEVPRLMMIDPPVFPRVRTHEYSPEALARLARARSEGFVNRLERMARKRPELADWYAPGAPGHVHAINVAEVLAVAYARFIPQPTTAPMSLIWSEQFAAGLQRRGGRWKLAQGPSENRIVANRAGSMTHHDLVRANARLVASYLEDVMERYRPSSGRTA
jgi:thioesterase domain-containing protein